jgi:hypothetical protein
MWGIFCEFLSHHFNKHHNILNTKIKKTLFKALCIEKRYIFIYISVGLEFFRE